jgi:hypothetical protein
VKSRAGFDRLRRRSLQRSHHSRKIVPARPAGILLETAELPGITRGLERAASLDCTMRGCLGAAALPTTGRQTSGCERRREDLRAHAWVVP